MSETKESVSNTNPVACITAADDALNFLNQQGDTGSSPRGLADIRHKVDRRILPFMFCCYFLQFIDKVMYNYAGVMGMKADLKLKGNDFSNAASAFFIAYLVTEVPNVYFLQKIPPAKWLGFNVICWGIAATAAAGAKDYTTLLVARIFLGIFEATVGPSLMLISSQYYTKSEQAPRFTFWFLGLGVAQIIGGVISFGFQHVHSKFASWRIMFLVMGLITVLVGFSTLFCLPDTPMQAKWLSDDEKVALLQHTRINQTGIRNSKFNFRQILEAVLDVQVWLFCLMVALQAVSSGVVIAYSSTLIAGFGFGGPVSALLNAPSGIVSISFTLLVGIGIRKASNRWAWVFVCSIPGIIGGGLMSFLPKDNRAGVLAGIYLVNAIVAPLPVIYHWVAANCAGYTKRAFASAAVAGFFCVGNIIGPQTFQDRDAPEYRPAKISVLATQAAAAVLAVVLFAYYIKENRRRERLQNSNGGEDPISDEAAWGGLTDKENQSFRYVY
ncbi:major facilitator superfamily domain-containing protein [Penicillium subrubescens]|uniref:Thiamine pathway transporter THI73 n=1 Tax=Penicillium subrubescens TaxID=1316194 RepID=A0A1Q5SNR4_9EURO|nr:major facilitator superfamily domain-containing protein [Penicillium subrubescens]KAJ5910817.1 major facilitator superfamily domain-containing protein [Penicillium subrubescens]OKO89515.1 Thiamine pathway transporter THI73 [Penicillium subrubescens]